MIVIGVTGGIASGKTIVSQVFETLGAVVINADVIGHETLTIDEIQHQVIDVFGAKIVGTDGTIDRPTLGQIVFSDPSARKKLEDVVREPILQEISRRIEALRAEGFRGVVVVDAPVLIEYDGLYLVDTLVVITTPEAVRIERLIKRNYFTAQEAKQRIQSQLTDEERVQHGDYVIDNQGTIEALKEQAREIWERIFNKGVE